MIILVKVDIQKYYVVIMNINSTQFSEQINIAEYYNATVEIQEVHS